jgi:hypothetical protein
MSPEDELDAKRKALQKLKDDDFLGPNDDPEGLTDTPEEHLKRILDKRKQDEEDALKYKG